MERSVMAVIFVGIAGLVVSTLMFMGLRSGPAVPAAPGTPPSAGAGGGSGPAGTTPTGRGSDEAVIDGATAFSFDPSNPLAPSPALEGYGLVVPAFALTDQDGQPVDQSALEGHATVLSFIFTHCVLICPTMTARMYEVYDAVRDTGARFVSITVDPERDTPARLRQYASGFGIDHSRWRFLTGDSELVRSIVRESLRFEVADDPSEANRINLPDGSSMSNITHPSKLILVGPNRDVIGLYSPSDDEDVQELIARLKAIGK